MLGLCCSQATRGLACCLLELQQLVPQVRSVRLLQNLTSCSFVPLPSGHPDCPALCRLSPALDQQQQRHQQQHSCSSSSSAAWRSRTYIICTSCFRHPATTDGLTPHNPAAKAPAAAAVQAQLSSSRCRRPCSLQSQRRAQRPLTSPASSQQQQQGATGSWLTWSPVGL